MERIQKAAKASSKQELFKDAIFERDVETVKTLLPSVDPNEHITGRKINVMGNTVEFDFSPIVLALFVGAEDIIKLLLQDSRLQIDDMNYFLDALSQAITKKRISKNTTIFILNNEKINVSKLLYMLLYVQPNNDEQKEIQEKFAKYIIDNNYVNVNHIENNLTHPLVKAAQRNHINMIKLFLENKDFDLDLIERSQEKPIFQHCTSNECKKLFSKYRLKNIIGKQQKMLKNNVIPADIWRKIIQRKLQMRLCSELQDEGNKEQLLTLAEVEFGVPEDVILEWRGKTKSQLCKIISGFITIGMMYSPDAMKTLNVLFESQRAMGYLEQLKDSLNKLNIETHNKYGNAKSIMELFDELREKQIVYSGDIY